MKSVTRQMLIGLKIVSKKKSNTKRETRVSGAIFPLTSQFPRHKQKCLYADMYHISGKVTLTFMQYHRPISVLACARRLFCSTSCRKANLEARAKAPQFVGHAYRA